MTGFNERLHLGYSCEDVKKIPAELARRTKVAELCSDALEQRLEIEERLAEGVDPSELDSSNFDALSPNEFKDIVSGAEPSELRDFRISHNVKTLRKLNG